MAGINWIAALLGAAMIIGGVVALPLPGANVVGVAVALAGLGVLMWAIGAPTKTGR